MIEQKHELPNGNTFIWLGNQPIHGCENVLLLAGGDILFLKTHRKVDGIKIRNDIKTLDKTSFLNAYGWPDNSSGNDLYLEIKKSS